MNYPQHPKLSDCPHLKLHPNANASFCQRHLLHKTNLQPYPSASFLHTILHLHQEVILTDIRQLHTSMSPQSIPNTIQPVSRIPLLLTLLTRAFILYHRWQAVEDAWPGGRPSQSWKTFSTRFRISSPDNNYTSSWGLLRRCLPIPEAKLASYLLFSTILRFTKSIPSAK